MRDRIPRKANEQYVCMCVYIVFALAIQGVMYEGIRLGNLVPLLMLFPYYSVTMLLSIAFVLFLI